LKIWSKAVEKSVNLGYNTPIILSLIVRRFIMAKITKDTIIGDVLDIAPEAAPMFLSIGMHCLGCPSSRGETVEEACMVHGVDADEFLTALNGYLSASAE
jgi:hybrid cluster-associated redox disulfide protein